MERALQRSILGHMCGSLFCSTSVQRTPRRPSSMASVSPTGPAPTIRTSVSMLRSRPLDVSLDRLPLLVDPAVGLGLLDHGAEALLPGGVARHLRPLAQRILENPRGRSVRQLGGSGQCLAGGVEAALAALDHEFEGAEVVAVLQRDAIVG